ncbi:ABC transporter integral membrane type 1 [Penicillium sp. CMV-2018d]|nr:ABC transporter integral membrane type 1 [Penicillium sp. CMV-2018d]
MTRSGLISMIYDQTIDMTAADLTDSAAITLMGTDVERIVANLKNMHEAWASIIEVGIAIWLLERELGVACFIPLVISLGSVLAMVPVSSRSGQAQKQWIERVQKRLAVTANTLGNMKAVQMLGLGDVILLLVSHLREIEVKTSVAFRKLLIWQVALSNLPTVLAPFATFTIYAIVSVVRHDESILSAQAFTSLALISLLTNPLLIFCQAMPAIWQAIACFNRIEAYCANDTNPSTKYEEEMQPLPTSEKSYPTLISFHNATIAWSSETEPVLHDLSVDIHRGITMIVGPVGCGKSTLIESILHQHMVKNGSRTASFARAAYCPQIPWIKNDTIRNNIIGFLEFDQTWYDFVCEVCGLQGDLDALSEGDMHMAGSGGISLSSGQKQRIALARAVYSRLDIVILDNVFTGLDSTSIALITNRLFGKDGHFKKLGISVILAMSTYFVNVFINVIIICAMGRYLAVSIPFLGVVLFFLQSYYLRTSRQVRLLDIEAKAPLYTHFLESIQGISSIKAFNWGPQMREKSHSLLNRSQRPVYMLYSIQQWLILVLDLVVGAIAVILIAMITSLRYQFNGASIGVALNILLTLNQTLANALKMWTMTEISVGAVSRVQRFIEDTPSEERFVASQIPPQLPHDWPCSGAVEFTGVTAGYDHSTTPVLKSLTLNIKPGEKIAVCGPSGSGKTSLIMTILQMLSLQSGHISIDGEDLAEIPRSTIRSCINVVPQDPFFMPGTLRLNLNPRQSVIDAELVRAVEKVGLWDRVRAKGGLDMEFSAADWSVGQRQLIALSRALVKKSAILILDEATSSVNPETEAIMQDIIAKEFSQQTIIAVVHRLRYIHWFDRVMLLKHGELVECDRAEALLQRDSDFRKLYLAFQEPPTSG